MLRESGVIEQIAILLVRKNPHSTSDFSFSLQSTTGLPSEESFVLTSKTFPVAKDRMRKYPVGKPSAWMVPPSDDPVAVA